MTDSDAETPLSNNQPKSGPKSLYKKTAQIFMKSMPFLSFGFSILALALALAPYLIPQARSHLISNALSPVEFEKVLTNYRTHQENLASQTQINSVKSTQAFLKNNPSLLKTEATDAVIGNRSAKTKLYVFLDYNCSACRAVDQHVINLVKASPDTALVIKQLPVITEISPTIARYALAANQMGVYEKAHHAFFTHRLRTEIDILNALTQSGLNAEQLRKIAYTPKIEQSINDSVALGEKLDLSGTPAYIINDILIPGGDVAAIRSVLQAAVKPKA